jgi:type IV pilus assembly protein PilV
MKVHTTRQSGITLIEVLIAMAVFSVGMIGMAGLMISGMRSNDAALMRTQSTILAQEIYENILANLPAAMNGDYDVAMGAQLPTSSQYNCYTGACDHSALAAWDLAGWGARVAGTMVDADASVAVDTSVDPAVVTVSFQFAALREASGPETETFTFMVRE